MDFSWFFFHVAANGYTSARASPGLLTVSNGNSLGKVVLAKSPPPPPSPQMVNSRKPDLRVITSQGGKSLMQMVSHIKLNLCSQKITKIHITFIFTWTIYQSTNIVASQKNSRISFRINTGDYFPSLCDVWLRCCSMSSSVSTQEICEVLIESTQSHWYIDKIFAESFFIHPLTLALNCVQQF